MQLLPIGYFYGSTDQGPLLFIISIYASGHQLQVGAGRGRKRWRRRL